MNYLSILIFQLFACLVILHAFLSSAESFLDHFILLKTNPGISLKCPTVCPQIRPNNMFDT